LRELEGGEAAAKKLVTSCKGKTAPQKKREGVRTLSRGGEPRGHKKRRRGGGLVQNKTDRKGPTVKKKKKNQIFSYPEKTKEVTKKGRRSQLRKKRRSKSHA